MTTASPFRRAIAAAPTTQAFGRRAVVSDDPAHVAPSAEVDREQAIRAADAYVQAAAGRYRSLVGRRGSGGRPVRGPGRAL